VRQAVVQAEGNSLDKLRIAQRLVDGTDRLKARKLLGDLDLLEAREKYYEIRDDLNRGRSRLAELELDGVSAENARRRAQLERRQRIRQEETRLALEREKLARTSRIISRSGGEVTQVLTARGDLLREGAPVVLLHAPKAERGADDSAAAYECLVFVPAGEGKKIEPGQDVEVVPATVKREEYGFIRGRVVAISDLPATRLALEAALEHPDLVDAFLKRYAPGVVLRVQVKLEDDPAYRPAAAGDHPPDRRNPFRWSSSSGPGQPLKTGTMCQAAIVVESRPLIRLILPWTRKLVGAD
jgi:HlyD family secretion protein